MEIWKKYKVWIVVGGIILFGAICAIIYFSVLNKGKQEGISKVLADIPDPANDAPLTDDERRQIADIATRLEGVMSGLLWTSFWSNTTPFYDLNTASTRVEIGVYQQYKKDRPNQDLLDDMTSLNSLNYDFDQMRDALVIRMKSALGL